MRLKEIIEEFLLELDIRGASKETIRSYTNSLKIFVDYIGEMEVEKIKVQLNSQLNNPTDEFVRFIIGDFFTGVKTANVVEKFRPIVKKSMQQFVNEFMNDKIKSILNNKVEEAKTVAVVPEAVETTEEVAVDMKI